MLSTPAATPVTTSAIAGLRANQTVAHFGLGEAQLRPQQLLRIAADIDQHVGYRPPRTGTWSGHVHA